ncbi:MAG: hypothetical protein U1F10_17510 [Burkholderiales bacterium]
MAATSTAYELAVVRATPWAVAVPRREAPVRWFRVGRDACMFAGLLAFAVGIVVLHLSLAPQAAVTSRAAVLLALALGATGIGAFLGAHWFHDRDTR